MPSQKLINELEAICERNRQVARRQELFDQDPTCGTCWQPIEKVEDCSNVKLENGQEFLSHDGCFRMCLDQMMTRFMHQPRGFRHLT